MVVPLGSRKGSIGDLALAPGCTPLTAGIRLGVYAFAVWGHEEVLCRINHGGCTVRATFLDESAAIPKKEKPGEW